MRIGSRVSSNTPISVSSDGMVREFLNSHRHPVVESVVALKQRLDAMPTSRCGIDSSYYQELVSEYADLSRLESMIVLLNDSAWPIARSKDADQTCALFDQLEKDLKIRLWFITHENKAVKESFEYWNASSVRKRVAKTFASLIFYKRALARIDAYKRAYGPIERIVSEYRYYDVLDCLHKGRSL